MVWLRPPALNAVTGADAVERTPPEARRRPVAVLGKISELNAVVGKHGVDAVGDASTKASRKAGAVDMFAFISRRTKANLLVRSIAA